MKAAYGKEREYTMIAVSRGQKIFNVFNIIFMLCIVFVTLYPFYYVAVASFSNSADFMMYRGFLYKPLGFNINAYRIVLRDDRILTGFVNSVILIVVRVSLAMLLTIIGAYVLSRKNTVFTPFLMIIVIVTMFFNGGMIPTYLNVRSLGLDNRMGALIFPSLINTFNMIIMRNAFEAVPGDIEEAASIDGAGRVQSLFKIMLPLVIPTVMVIFLYYAVEVWNAWFDAMIYIRKKSLYPLQLVLREILINNNTTGMGGAGAGGGDSETMAETVQYAVMMVATVPILVVYPFLQKYFVNGVMVGAVKG